MSSQIQSIKLYGQGGPNPPKVAMILEELGIPYHFDPTSISDIKKPAYLAVNPNGRLPAIHDPNTKLTLWESGAIVEYLIEQYDTKHQLSFASGTPESFHAKQWLFFQVSGQGPYYGQATWFKKFHPEHIPSAVDRYTKEIHRVSAVLDGWLAKQKEEHGGSGDGPWLVGNKISFADIVFIQWQTLMGMVFSKEEYSLDEYSYVSEWISKMTAREAIKAALEKAGGPSK